MYTVTEREQEWLYKFRKTDFKSKTITYKRQRKTLLIKSSIQQEGITIVRHLFTHLITDHQNILCKMGRTGEIGSPTILAGDFNTPFSIQNN